MITHFKSLYNIFKWLVRVHIINTRGFLFTAAAVDLSPLRRRRHIYIRINLFRRFYTLDEGYLSLLERSLLTGSFTSDGD